MGLGRGSALAAALASLADAEVAYMCDVDRRRLANGMKQLGGAKSQHPQAVADFRKILDDKSVDALVVAAPDHWHAPAAILACSAGKHVYVEKPCCHNPHEGELAIAAARKHDRIVQVGTQRRSWPALIEAVEKMRAGEIGRVLYARAWYANHRPSIGRGKPAPVPEWLDYSLWQGPAPERPFKDNYLHYFWHNYWHWGTGEMGNNGVHGLDLCRWGLGVDYPTRVVSGGGKYRYEDDQQTPDTHTVTFEFGDRAIFWEGLSWSPRGMEGESFGASFHGERGTLVMTGSGYAIYASRTRKSAQRMSRRGMACTCKTFSPASASIARRTPILSRATSRRCFAISAISPTAPAARSTAIRKTAISLATTKPCGFGRENIGPAGNRLFDLQPLRRRTRRTLSPRLC
jgi:predicted dehydrogenase